MANSLAERSKITNDSRIGEAVVLIGTDHRYQKGKETGSEEFQGFLEETCREYSIESVAEEMSLEALEEDGVAHSTCKLVADSLDLPHEYCDPDRTEREDLGIKQSNEIKMIGHFQDWDEQTLDGKIRESYLMRERYWIEKLKNLNRWPILFICGADHFNSFAGLLKQDGRIVRLITRNWEPSSSPPSPSASAPAGPPTAGGRARR